MKNCSNKECLKEQPLELSEFSKDKQKKDGLKSRCRDCENTRAKLYFYNNRENRNEINNQWHIDNPDKSSANRHRRRARLKNVSHLGNAIGAQIKTLMEVTKYCPYCDKEIKDGHIDHVKPIAFGGSNNINNLLYCCSSCNLSKGSKLIQEWKPDFQFEVK